MNGTERIAAERRRQVDREGYDDQHDDVHDREELAKAAGSYVVPALSRVYCSGTSVRDGLPTLWPWAARYWKPASEAASADIDPVGRIRDLERGGALVAAEIDRLLRVCEQRGFDVPPRPGGCREDEGEPENSCDEDADGDGYSAQDVLDAMRFALDSVGSDVTRRAAVASKILTYGPETTTDGGVRMIHDLIVQRALRVTT